MIQVIRSLFFTIWAYGSMIVLGIGFYPGAFLATAYCCLWYSPLGGDGTLGFALDCGHPNRVQRP